MKLLVRLSPAAWQLLRRLHDERADLALCTDPVCYRFHMAAAGVHGDIVRNLTMEALIANGLLQRVRTCTPTYKVSSKGTQALRSRGLIAYPGDGLCWDCEPAQDQAASIQEVTC